MLSLSQITQIEEADALGAKTLGVALDQLMLRWDSGLTDDETFIRVLFLKWYSLCEPNWYNGLPDSQEISIENFIEGKGKLSSFQLEHQFIIGVLANSFPWCFGDEEKWKNISQELLSETQRLGASSPVFSNSKYLLGQAKEVNGLRKNIFPELRARFYGRGEMGRYLLHILGNENDLIQGVSQ